MTFVKSDDIFKNSRYVHCPYLQKPYHIYQVTTLNEFINEVVYTVICHLTCDPVNYHLYGVSPLFTCAGSGQVLIGLRSVRLRIGHIIARGSHLDNDEQFSFILLLFSSLLRTKWITKAGTHQQCFYVHFTIQECIYWVLAHIFKLFSCFSF